MPHRTLLVALVLLPLPIAGAAPPATAVDFRRDIQPLLTARCAACHGATRARGGLRLDDGTAALLGGNSGPAIKPGDSAASRLLRVVSGQDPDLKMPPEGKPPLTAAEVALLRAWIEQGARWPRDAAAAKAPAPTHWSFQPIRRPPVPPADTRAQNPIDAFILARLRKEGIASSPEADRPTLIRRLSLDLLGLPPRPEDVDAFVLDSRPGAYERLVDRLLASPHYGERWARHWLDGARYADSDGYEKDTGRPHAWRYRHWVIDALNRDLPFDEFTREQMAGDLLPGATPDQMAATGFHRNTLTNREGGVDQEQFRVEQVVDRVNTTARVFLGLTLGCAQCHDHKYDPLSMRDYYGLVAFFNSDVERDLPAPLPREPPPPPPPQPETGKKATPSSGTLAPTLALGSPRKTHVLIRGDFLRPGAEVLPATPAALPAAGEPRTRLDLARWLTDPANPLTARVTVNAAWHRFFGRGLVPTLDDFGTQGEPPSHPELLDWLACEFQRRGWSQKDLHRLIVTSATYRQSAAVRPALATRDPLNVLLARQARLRLEGEVIRDSALAASGLLSTRIGGPSVRPPQPPGISELTYAGSARWVESTGLDRTRRGLYTWFQRTSPYPMLMTFDAPDANVCCVRRERSNTPLQALTLLNDTVFVECAQALARRVLADSASQATAGEWLRRAFRLCVVREPTPDELARLASFHADLRRSFSSRPANAARLAGPLRPSAEKPEDLAALVAVARALLNLDEFVTRE